MPDKPEPQTGKQTALNIQLVPRDHADRPILSNYTTLSVAPGMVYLDFGFLDPHVLTALSRAARTGKAAPPTLDGTLAARVAVGYDVLQNLHQQLGQVLQGLRGASVGKP